MARTLVRVLLDGLDRKGLAKLRTTLRWPDRTLRQMGALVLAEAQKAFREQRLGEHLWPARYEGRGQPHVNVAGVVVDFLSGRAKPKPIRFVDRPAGVDTGQTMRGLTPRVMVIEGNQIRFRLPTPQAKKMQSENKGDRTSTLQVNRTVKDALTVWLRQRRRSAKRAKGRSQPLTREDAAAKRLGFLFRRSELTVTAARRPFFGITPVTARRLQRIAAGAFLPPGLRGSIS